MDNKTFTITRDDNNRRIDRVIRKFFPDLSLSIIYKSLRKGQIKLNDKKVAPSEKVSEGDTLYININGMEVPEKIYKQKEQKQVNLRARTILEPNIIYENRNVLVINKPRGILIHGRRSLDEIVKSYLESKTDASLSFTPGPVHRLDRNTTGLIIFSCSLKGARELSEIFKERLCEKYYLALCDGHIERITTWDDTLARNHEENITYRSEEGQQAITKVIPIFVGKHTTLALMKIKTGRTHQIRVQASLHGHPLTGDKKYGGSNIIPHYMLHSAGIKLKKSSKIAGFSILTAPLPKSAEVTLKNILSPLAVKKAMDTLKHEIYSRRTLK